MNKHKQLDLILKYMSENLDAIPRRPDEIIRSAKLNLYNKYSYRMFRFMLEDGYVYEHYSKGVPTGTYGITFKGLIFLENGGYEFEHKKYLRKKRIENISDKLFYILKPFSLLSLIIGIIYTVYRITIHCNP